MYDNFRINGTDTDSNRNWVDNRDFYDRGHARKAEDDPSSAVFKLKNPKAEDKMEQIGRLADYQVNDAVPNSLENRTIQDAKEEYLRDERQMAKESVTFLSYYKGGIGINFDSKV